MAHLSTVSPFVGQQYGAETAVHAKVLDACRMGEEMVDRLSTVEGRPYSVHHAMGTFSGESATSTEMEMGLESGHIPPKLAFLPEAKALIFYRSTKVGLGLGMERGSGFIVARLAQAATGADYRPGIPQWSAPCFITVTGGNIGILAGFERTDTMVGVMSDKAFDAIVSKRGSFVAGSDWNIALTPIEAMGQPRNQMPDLARPSPAQVGSQNLEWAFKADFAVVSVAKGMMVDVAFSGKTISFDSKKNAEAYGSGISGEQILRGAVAPPGEMKPLLKKLNAVMMLDRSYAAKAESQAAAMGRATGIRPVHETAREYLRGATAGTTTTTAVAAGEPRVVGQHTVVKPVGAGVSAAEVQREL